MMSVLMGRKLLVLVRREAQRFREAGMEPLKDIEDVFHVHLEHVVAIAVLSVQCLCIPPPFSSQKARSATLMRISRFAGCSFGKRHGGESTFWRRWYASPTFWNLTVAAGSSFLSGCLPPPPLRVPVCREKAEQGLGFLENGNAPFESCFFVGLPDLVYGGVVSEVDLELGSRFVFCHCGRHLSEQRLEFGKTPAALRKGSNPHET